MKLSELKVGESGKVECVSGSAKMQKRLSDMGLYKGVKITVVRFAPFKCPMEIKVGDFYLALRIKDADNITVKI